MQPHYYLMRAKKILRLEWETSFESLPFHVREQILSDPESPMNQEQANWRVVLFRDEIMEYDEYSEWLASPEALVALQEEEYEYDLTAN